LKNDPILIFELQHNGLIELRLYELDDIHLCYSPKFLNLMSHDFRQSFVKIIEADFYLFCEIDVCFKSWLLGEHCLHRGDLN